MADKKLTDKDVVDGLERCISTTTAEACVGCPFKKQNLCNKDQWALERYALDLIKRQKAENDSAKAKIEICAEAIERQDAEIKRVKKCLKCVYEYDGEITEYCVQGPCSNFKTVEQIKVEAYKEFAERIRECCNSNDDLSADVWLSVTTDIDCVLKEMVGEE